MSRVACFLAACSLSLFAASASAELEHSETRYVDASKARAVHALKVDVGPATLWLEDGLVMPVVSGGLLEGIFIFEGQGLLSWDTEDSIERDQVKLFSGREVVRERFSSAVIATGSHELMTQFTEGEARDAGSECAENSQELLARWSENAASRVTGVGHALWLARNQEKGYSGFVAAWMQTDEHGDLFLIRDPDSTEPVALGAFHPLDLSEWEERATRRMLDELQEGGRYLGLRVEDLGVWDWWIQTKDSGESRSLAALKDPFEATHFDLDLQIKKKGSVEGTARIKLRANIDGRQHAVFRLTSDLQVKSARTSAGATLTQRRFADYVVVGLGESSRVGTEYEVVLEYEGKLLYAVKGRPTMRNTLGWYPHIGEQLWATYEMCFRWPSLYQLHASGDEIERTGGESPSARYKITKPTSYVTFELAQFEEYAFKIGAYKVRVAVDRAQQHWLGEENAKALARNTSFVMRQYEKLFGRSPTRSITLVTTRRNFSQSTFGLITLSGFDLHRKVKNLYAAFTGDDYRFLLAHELAHQWWGVSIGWASYRDQWISEAMAQYAVGVIARAEFERKGEFWTSPWAREMWTLWLQERERRARHQVGPVTLGGRLDSSVCSSCYVSIVYGKGPAIIGTFESYVGEEQWLWALNTFSTWAKGRRITTEMFLQGLAKVTQIDLSPISDATVYERGMSTYYFTFEKKQNDEGKWEVTIEVREEASSVPEYRVVEVSDGLLDIRVHGTPDYPLKGRISRIPVLLVTEEIAGGRTREYQMVGDDSGKLRRERLLKWIDESKTVVKGDSFEVTVKDGVGEARFVIDEEPVDVLLDPDEMVLGWDFCQSYRPMKAAAEAAMRAASRNRNDEARRLATKALDAPLVADESLVEVSSEVPKTRRRRWSQLLARTSLAQVAMNEGDLDRAEEQLAKASKAKIPSAPRWYKHYFENQQARFYILKGRARKAYNLLWDRVETGDNDTLEGYFLLAVAAQTLDELESLEEVDRAFEGSGYDLDRIRVLMRAALAGPAQD